MSNFERGSYDPQSEDPDVFDGAEDDDDEEGSRLPLLIVIALLVLAAFAGVVWLAYSQGVAHGRGKTQVASQSGQSSGGDTVKTYEQPAPTDEDADVTTAGPNAGPSEPVAAPTTAPSEPAPAPVTTTQQTVPKPVPHPAETLRLMAPPPQETASKPVSEPPALKPAAVKSAPQQVATAAPASAPPAEPKPAVATRSVALQIGAYKSEAEASSAWAAYKGKHESLVNTYGPSTVKIDLGAKGTWYRLRMGPFGSRADALVLCEKLKADGGACFLAK